jgi:predicted transcriptional regulator
MSNEQPTELAAKIIAAYVRRNQIAPDQLGTLISTVHRTLASLGNPVVEAGDERTPAVSIRRSVTPNFVVCMDCGWKGQMLRRHIGTHGLSVREYRARWNLPADHLMTAPDYSERRSGLAKRIGFGRGGRRASVEALEPATCRKPGSGGTSATWATEVSSGVGVGSRSDQGNNLPLRLGVRLDVSGGRSQAGMARELLNVAETAADLADFPGGAIGLSMRGATGDEAITGGRRNELMRAFESTGHEVALSAFGSVSSN